jgi:hypothetical protein
MVEEVGGLKKKKFNFNLNSRIDLKIKNFQYFSFLKKFNPTIFL